MDNHSHAETVIHLNGKPPALRGLPLIIRITALGGLGWLDQSVRKDYFTPKLFGLRQSTLPFDWENVSSAGGRPLQEVADVSPSHVLGC